MSIGEASGTYGAGGLSVRWVPEVNTCRLRAGGFDDNDVTCRFVRGDGKKSRPPRVVGRRGKSAV